MTSMRTWKPDRDKRNFVILPLIANGGECEGNAFEYVCLSEHGRVTQKLLLRLT